MSSSTGTAFRITTFGESHGPALGVVVDGCPPRLALAREEIQRDLDRRRPGQSRLTTPRGEPDQVEILSGLSRDGRTLGTPIGLLIRNEDARGGDYREMDEMFRPSHADYTYQAKYGIREPRGGGRASARETAARVAAGAVARKLLQVDTGVEVLAWVRQVGSITSDVDPAKVRLAHVERTPVRCPDPAAALRMIECIDQVRREGDSIGGVVEVVARGVPAGWGEPVFDKLEADLAKALLSLPASKGFEIGSGFGSLGMKGSEHNDPFVMRKGRVRTKTNQSGGIQGGISNGEAIVCRVVFKPTATIRKPQVTVDVDGRRRTLAARGRHDPCVLPRAVPVVEAAVLLVLADHFLRQRAIAR
ncbi:MAG: chorismate synthase [Deltaproteobacteria bacterium]|nr:chorismate synthase [Deltaproteobacteria bacterium]